MGKGAEMVWIAGVLKEELNATISQLVESLLAEQEICGSESRWSLCVRPMLVLGTSP